MISRASRNRRLRNRAWALVAALLPATECWAFDAPTATAGDNASAPTATAPAGSARSKIPPPRIFNAREIAARTPAAGTGSSKIPPPRVFNAEEITARTPAAGTGSSKIPPPREFVTAPDKPQLAVEPAAAEPQADPSSPVPQAHSEAPAPDPVSAAPPAAEPAPMPASLNQALQAPLNDPAPASEPMPRAAFEPVPVAPKADPIAPPAAEPEAVAAPIQEPQKAAEPEAVAAPIQEPQKAAEPEAAAAPIQEPRKDEPNTQPAKDVEPAQMPSALNQAIETLTRTPSIEPDAAQAPQTEPVPSAQPPAPAPRPILLSEPAPVSEGSQPKPDAQPAPHDQAEASTPSPSPAQAQAPVPAQAPAQLQTPVPPQPSVPAQTVDNRVEPTSCTTCGGFHSGLDGSIFHNTIGCAGGNCVPGQKACHPLPNECNTVVGAFCANLYQALCCPDPCYQPKWVPAANASFFADYARPRTVTRFRVDRGIDMVLPTRNEFFLTKAGLPSLNRKITAANGRRYLLQSDPSLNWTQGYFYQEAAGEKGSFFMEVPYRQINPLWNKTQAGIGDINIGSKSLLFDTELLQVSFQFRTYLPSGDASSGLGTGHVSLDPSVLASLKLADDTYFQAQVGQWIPIGGISGLRGGMAYWFLSLNQVLWHVTPDSPLIGTLEMDGWSFQNGGAVNPIALTNASGQVLPGQGRIASGGGTYFNIGPGLRWSVCNKVDFGGALTWATTDGQWASPWFRFEVRFLF